MEELELKLPLHANLTEEELKEKSYNGGNPDETILVKIEPYFHSWPIQISNPPQEASSNALCIHIGNEGLMPDVLPNVYLFSRITIEAVLQQLVNMSGSVKFGLYDFTELKSILRDLLRPEKNPLITLLDEQSDTRFVLCDLIMDVRLLFGY